MVVESNSTEPYHDDPFSEYQPAVIKCFAMMSLGYFSGRLRFLSPSDAEGINKFASYWALPSLMYLTVATHDFSTIRWRLILAILLGKMIIFIIVMIFCSLFKLPRKMTAACFYATFYVVTNDAGLGNVLVQGLCTKICSNMPVHLFYLQPISTMLFYSLAFVVMKTDNVERSRRRLLSKDSLRAAWTTAKNPLILAFVAGLITSSILRHPLPYYLSYVLSVVIAAFPANVLFWLGISMVGKFQLLFSTCCSDYASWLPIISFFVKMIATPVLLHTVVINFPNTEVEDSSFAFLYGIMAPSMQAIQSSKQYGFPTEPVSSTLALSNLAFLPISYFAAKAAFDNLEGYFDVFRKCLLYISVASLASGLLINVLIFWKKKLLGHSKTIVIWLSVCQMTLALGVVLKFSFRSEMLIHKIDQVLVFCGQVTCHTLAANLTVFLYLKCHFNVKKSTYFLLVGFGIPALLTACVLTFSVYLPSNKLPFTLAYERNWLLVNTVATGCSLIVSVTFLCLHLRNTKYKVIEDCFDDSGSNIYAIPIDRDIILQSDHFKNRREQAESTEIRRNACSHSHHCESQNKLCVFSQNSAFSKDLFGLLVILCALMIQTFTAQLFKLASDASSSIFIAIEFLSSAGNFSQGIITFLWFGVNIQPFISLVKQRWRNFRTCIVSIYRRRRSRKIHISSL